MDKQLITSEPIHDYCVTHSSSMPEIFKELAERTSEAFPQVAHMQVGDLEGNFLSLLTQISKAYRILEFGTFTGCSSLAFALALPDEGKVTTLDRDPKATAIAKEFWKKAKVDGKVEFILGDGKDSVKTLLKEVKDGSRRRYDLVFIDADKGAYDFYYEAALQLLRVGGMILADNVLWSGRVLDPKEASDHTLHAFNDKLKNDPRIDLVMLPIRDGLTLAVLKP